MGTIVQAIVGSRAQSGTVRAAQLRIMYQDAIGEIVQWDSKGCWSTNNLFLELGCQGSFCCITTHSGRGEYCCSLFLKDKAYLVVPNHDGDLQFAGSVDKTNNQTDKHGNIFERATFVGDHWT
ncbi:unnamed protein product [Ilex paraguariensis]|uniref:Uncharacterized protein n=1 Tax=Ilex paraguariensis TaxID=185542 RepID=A0ABC8RDN4_9AQUA